MYSNIFVYENIWKDCIEIFTFSLEFVANNPNLPAITAGFHKRAAISKQTVSVMSDRQLFSIYLFIGALRHDHPPFTRPRSRQTLRS